MSFNLPPGCTLADIDRAFGPGDEEDGPRCYACGDLGWLVFEDGSVVLVVPCTECSEEVTHDDLVDIADSMGVPRQE
jgi:hypothetical protein